MLTEGGVGANDVGNADGAHPIIGRDNGRTLRFAAIRELKNANLVSGGEGFTMVARLSTGRDYRIEPPFIIFTPTARSYPIKGVTEDVPGVDYRGRPKVWIDTKVMSESQSEPSVIRGPSKTSRTCFVPG